MKITLELWCDQSCITDEINSSMWILKLNGEEFPTKNTSVMDLMMAHEIIVKLMQIEEIANNDNGNKL
jgi:hypothetical protein